MAAYGVECVVEALKRPMAQIVANAGFNPLEKMGDVIAAQTETAKILWLWIVTPERLRICTKTELSIPPV